MKIRRVLTRFIGISAILLTAVIVFSLNTGRAQAFNWLNPNPNPAIVDFAYDTLANCDSRAPQYNPSGRTPAFSQWLSPAGRSDIAQNTYVFTKPAVGTTIPLRFNLASAVCFKNSAVLQTTVQYLRTDPNVNGLPPGAVLNYTPAGGPGNYNLPGTYRWTGTDFTYTIPNNLAPGTYNFTVPISIKRINQFTTNRYICVSGGGSIFVNNAIDFGRCPILTLPINITVVVPAPVLVGLVANCQLVSGAVENADNVTVEALLDGQSIGIKNLSVADNRFSFTTPDRFKDGVSHTARIILRRTSDNVQLYVGDYAQSPCTPNAACAADFSANIAAVFPGNLASLGVGDTVKVKVTMTNNGESIWTKAYGDYKLSLTPAAASFWSMSGGDLSGTIKPIPDPVSSNSFIITLQLIKSPTSASTPLQFQMRFANGAFGAICATSLRIQADYNPWLRVQNGNVAALGTILGQKAGTRGGYKAEGSGEDINLDAQYAIAAYATSNSFCSANAYNYGRGDSIKCDFDAYKFNVPGDFSYLLDPTSTDKFVEYASSLQSGGQCITTPGTSTGQRYRNGGNIGAFAPSGVDFGTLKTGGPVSSCPAFFEYGSGTKSIKAPAVINGASKLQITGGRATLIVHGDLEIKTDIVYAPAAGLSVSPRSGGDYDEAAMNRLPNLGIIVDGNVVIDGNVKQIDAAIYSSGSINTCDFYPRTTGALPPGPSLAPKCANKLAIRGGLFARKGFSFGRNYYDVAGISSRIGQAVASPNFDYSPMAPGQSQGQYYGGPAEDILGNGLALILAPPGFENITKLAASEVKYLEGNYSPRF